MQANYTQKYSNDDKKPIKIVFLGFCILLDLIVLSGVIACFSTKKYIDLLIYLAIFIVATIIRIASLFLTFEIIINIEGDSITIIKKYPTKEKLLYKGKISALQLEKCNVRDGSITKKCIRLCSKSCENGIYMIELFERKYLIYFDDYAYSLIEVRSDLS